MTPGPPRTGGREVTLLPDCGGHSTCARIELELPSPTPDTTILKVDTVLLVDTMGTEGNRIRIEFNGSLASGPWQRYALVFETEHDFGCGFLALPRGVPVVGFTAQHDPILLTSEGELTVDHRALDVGCERCGELREPPTYRVVDTVLTPAWDFWSIGYSARSFTYDDAGTLFVSEGSTCVAISSDARFRSASEAVCVGLEEVGNYSRKVEGLVLEPAQWLFRVSGRKHLLFLHAGACT